MKRALNLYVLYVGVFLLGLILTLGVEQTVLGQGGNAPSAPSFQVDPYWPKPLPNNWVVGHVPGVAVDSKDNVYIIHRGRFQGGAEKTPDLLVFDPAGNVIRSWGASVRKSTTDYPVAGKDDWGSNVHGIYIDYKDNVWVTFGGTLGVSRSGGPWLTPEELAGSAANAHVLKYTSDGKFLLEIGKYGKGTEGSNSTMYLGQPTDAVVDPKTDEVYISDGYTNRRVIVFDANTGAYKRHWGANGKRPVDVVPAGGALQQFSTPHCVNMSKDGLVYVCDRGNRRIQVFKPDGTFVREKVFETGAPADIEISRDPAQRLMFVMAMNLSQVWILQRDSFELLSNFGRRGRWAGQFEAPHALALDSKGNLYVAESLEGRRLQKFVPK